MVFDNPSTPNHGSLALPYHLTIYRVALSVDIPSPQVRFMCGDCLVSVQVVAVHETCPRVSSRV